MPPVPFVAAAVVLALVAILAGRILLKVLAFVALCLALAALYGVPVVAFFAHLVSQEGPNL